MLDGELKHAAGLKRLSRRANALALASGSSPGPGPALSVSDYGRAAMERLRQRHLQIAEGLSEEEFERVEATFHFTFPPDLKGILRQGVPVGLGFPDWRGASLQQLRRWIDRPIAGLLAGGSFWWKNWGQKPESSDKIAKMAHLALKKAPILIPVYGHCFIPAQPNHAGNPIFFVDCKEIAYCGLDVSDFLYSFDDFASSQFSFLPTSTATGDVFSGQEAGSSCNNEENISSSRDLEASALRSEEFDRDLETWGRNLDALGRNSELFSRRGMNCIPRKLEPSGEKSGEDSPFKSMQSNCFDDLQDHSCQFFRHFPKIDSTLTAKIARRIEFWSDLADRQQRSNIAPHICANSGLGSIHHKSMNASAVDEDDNALLKFRKSYIPKWLAAILEDVSTGLLQGGWKDEEISEIMDCFSSPSSSHKILTISTQSASETLALQLDFLSSSLRKAGWSIQDVAEALSLDSTPNANISPELLASRIVPLAEFVADR